MFSEVRFRGFRCFSDLQVAGLKRINLIGGKNNVGKTTFLEGVCLICMGHNPAQAIRLNIYRGYEKLRASSDAIWGDWFSQKGEERVIKLDAKSIEAGETNLLIRAERPTVTPVDRGDATVARQSNWVPVYELSHAGRKEEPVRADLRRRKDGEWVLPRPAGVPLWPGVFLHVRGTGPEEDANRFSKLDTQNNQEALQRLLEGLRVLAPELSRLSVRIDGPVKCLQAEAVRDQPLLPLGVLGNGLKRLAGILLAIEARPKGVVLVDELENGIHHSVLPQVWRAILNSARGAGVQVFATTHSYECIRAAIQALPQEELTYFRLQVLDGEVRPVMYPPEVAASAVETDTEMR